MSATPAPPASTDSVRAYKRAIWGIAGGILIFAACQAVWAMSLGSRQLLKDALDWGYDVVIYALAAVVFGRGVRAEQAGSAHHRGSARSGWLSHAL